MSRTLNVSAALIVATMLVGACGGGPTSATVTTAAPAASTSTVNSQSTVDTSPISSSTSTTASEDVEPADLLVVGDWGSGTLPQGAVAGAMQTYAAEHAVEAILTTGDNFYEDDLEFLMAPFGWVTEAGIPFWITWGNHDVESETRIAAMNQAFGEPPRWGVHEWGAVDVINLDSNQIDSPQQAQFFLDAMDDSTRPTIVTMHHSPFSCARYEQMADLVDRVVEVVDDDVFLVLSGHDHVYQRFEHDGVAYVVTGGGGATIYELSACPSSHPEPLAGEETHHFVALSQNSDGIELVALDVNGDVIDEFVVDLP